MYVLFVICFSVNAILLATSVFVQDLPVYNETIPLVLPGKSSIHIVDIYDWPMKWLVQNGTDGKWLNDSRYMFGCYDYVAPIVPYYPAPLPHELGKITSPVISELTPKKTVVLDTHIIFIYFVNHIYHVLVETMPQIYTLYLNSIFALYPDATILCGNDLANDAGKAVIAALKVDIHTDRFMRAENGVTYMTDATHSVILPQKSKFFRHYPSDINAQSFLLKAIGDRIPPNPHPTEQIYISRSRYRRHALNETVMLDILRKHMKLTVYNNLDEMKLEDQWAIFGNASLVIAPHGGALTNTMFCNKEKVAIIEVSGRKPKGSFDRDVASWGITKYHDIWVNNTANLDLIFDPHAVAKEMLQFLHNISHPMHGPHRK